MSWSGSEARLAQIYLIFCKFTPVQCMVADTIQDFYKLEHNAAVNIVDVRSIAMH